MELLLPTAQRCEKDKIQDLKKILVISLVRLG